MIKFKQHILLSKSCRNLNNEIIKTLIEPKCDNTMINSISNTLNYKVVNKNFYIMELDHNMKLNIILPCCLNFGYTTDCQPEKLSSTVGVSTVN